MQNVDLSRQSISSIMPESKVAVIPLPQEDPDNEVKDFPDNCEINSEKKSAKPLSEQKLKQLLSNLLKYGVFLASAIVLWGGILYLMRHGAEPADYRVFHGVPSEFSSPDGVINAVFSGSRRGIIQLGLLILIATPIIRVAISFLAFLRQRDFVYVVVTWLVLSILIYSVVGAYY